MSHHAVVDAVGVGALHTISAGLALTSIAGALGYVPVIIAAAAGIAAITSYTFSVLDSPAFQRLWARLFKSIPPQ